MEREREGCGMGSTGGWAKVEVVAQVAEEITS